jgi:hypothetical protein
LLARIAGGQQCRQHHDKKQSNNNLFHMPYLGFRYQRGIKNNFRMPSFVTALRLPE